VDEKTEIQEWIRQRASLVLKRYSAFEALTENGIELEDRHTDLQIKCPWHGQDNKPSGRYYGTGPQPHFYCFVCKLNLNGIGIYAKFRGLEFMRALSELENRFGTKVPRKPEVDIPIPADKNGSYESQAWLDVPRLIDIIETKLLRVRDKVNMIEYVEWCKVIDYIIWDLSQTEEKTNPDMVLTLMKLKDRIDKTSNIYEII
jgi:hypothetical protein